MAGYIGHNPVRKNYAVDEFTTSAAQASSGNFTLSQTIADSKMLEVSVGGIDQPQSAYSVTGTTLAFGASIVAQGDIVIARHAGESLMYPTLEANAVDSGNITAGAVDDAHLATGIDSTKLTGTIADGRIPSLATSKITTGTFDDARISASSVVQHSPSVDLSPVKNDISLLALQTAINGNLSAHGLKNSWIEQFENSTYIENLTTVSRVVDPASSDEFVASVYSTLSTPAYITGDRRSRITVTQSGWSLSQGTITNILDGTISEVSGTAILGTAISDNTGDYFNFDFGSAVNVSEFKWYRNATTTIGAWQFSGSANADHSSSVNLGSTFTLGGTASGAHPGTPQIVTAMSANTDSYRYYRITGTGGTSTGNNWDSEIYFKEATGSSVANATGSFNSTDVVPQDATNKSSVGLVILYKDIGSSNCALNTDVVAKVRANTGQAYQTLVLAGAGTYSDSLKIAIAPAITVTAGQALSYEISFANQASGTKEARIYGVAMTY